MTFQRTPYAEASTPGEMTRDCRAVESALRLPERRGLAERATAAAPSLRYEDAPHDVPKPVIDVSEAAARLAAAIHPYLD